MGVMDLLLCLENHVRTSKTIDIYSQLGQVYGLEKHRTGKMTGRVSRFLLYEGAN